MKPKSDVVKDKNSKLRFLPYNANQRVLRSLVMVVVKNNFSGCLFCLFELSDEYGNGSVCKDPL